jgi:hypothetical protein
LLANIVAATGIDPRFSYTYGIFFVDKTEMSKCFKEFAIAHDRSTNSYRQSWIDILDFAPYLNVNENKEFTFTVETESVTGDIYFMVDTYFDKMIPRGTDCINQNAGGDPT